MDLFKNLAASLHEHAKLNAFCINKVYYTYTDLALAVSAIRKKVKINTKKDEKIIGLVANDDLKTYASIIALWLEGKAYVPISPEAPSDRNKLIIQSARIKTIIDSSDLTSFSGYEKIQVKNLRESELNLTPKITGSEELVYLLFTSGTTGIPKGVPISRANLTGFIHAFWQMGFQIDHQDRCLQMFDLTFDLSVMSYLVPLLRGACVYTIPKDKMKYSYINELMEEKKLTVALMVPSILHFLRPYFDEIHFPEMRYSLFCGEALPLDVTEEWAERLPNARIFNVYGPTEDTIFCTYYEHRRSAKSKAYKGVLSIGKAMKGSQATIFDEDHQLLPAGQLGQLCLAGVQLTPGYWYNDEKNKESFFSAYQDGKEERFYKTGDLCLQDEDGDLHYGGRIDFQTKIQGFRVELSEIEFHARNFLIKTNVAAVAVADAIGNTEIGLVIESKASELSPLNEYLKTKLPTYMIPKQIEFIDKFPLNSNGKTDRKKLQSLFDDVA